MEDNPHDYSVFKDLEIVNKQLKESLDVLKGLLGCEVDVVMTNAIDETSDITIEISKTLVLSAIISIYIDKLKHK